MMLMVGATKDESGQVPNEEIVKLAFIVRDHQQVHMMFPVTVLGSVE